MPELPEVETVARGLQREISGSKIVSVALGKTDFIDNPEAVESELPGRTVLRVERYGKFLLLRLSANEEAEEGDEQAALLVHLGMTGALMPKKVSEPQAKHTHVVMMLGDGRELRYVDPRRFGRIAYLAGDVLARELQRFGADPLETGLEEFARRIHGRKARIKALLLDQSVLRGVGNIYADESLWKAKIHPAQLGAGLKREQVEQLYAALQRILKKAILLRGSSISDFLDAEGVPGEYQQHHRAYGREGKPCFRCETAVRRVIVAGRSSYFCPSCQRAPRRRKKTGKTKAQRERSKRG
ncbi:MAG TPA: bifunctional DNA-formamidopyrimidine glycosylase/DNA-(apurinic or apyrimidinic site) lyase [Candidatus Acidoferrum sp.]|nr:bifunctional DNA-formamidopyrimidine glycosylase/DNA-(apurinic or apyrimidinic site) lyase [Candidatus Acidoferrum sp.]